VLSGTATTAEAQQNEAIQIVEKFHESLLSVMKEADTLGVQGRYDRLYEPITSAFHMRLMVSIAAGSSWKSATSSERAELAKAFTRMSVSTYASRFDGYSGQSFRTHGARATARGLQLVDTAIESPDEESVTLTYVLKESGGDLRVVDVLLDRGISELAVRRSEFSAILRRSGISGLISLLNEKSDKLTGT
jgi:phospholipid transport system substrate-binding protein